MGQGGLARAPREFASRFLVPSSSTPEGGEHLLDACELEFGEDSAKINRIVSCIQALPFDDWRGAALLWLSRKPSPRQTLEFFKALDAL